MLQQHPSPIQNDALVMCLQHGSCVCWKEVDLHVGVSLVFWVRWYTTTNVKNMHLHRDSNTVHEEEHNSYL